MFANAVHHTLQQLWPCLIWVPCSNVLHAVLFNVTPDVSALAPHARTLPVQEIVHISPTMLPNYDEKIKMFYEEHIHSDDEIRYILDGSGGSNEDWG